MVHIKDGLLRCLRPVNVSQHIVVFLLLTHFCGGQSQEIGRPQPVMVMVGDDTVLPCQLKPPINAVSMTMEWGRPDLDPRFVYVWHDGKGLLDDQNKAYKGRASLSIDKLKHGDLSLALSKVNISDNGMYRCFIPTLSQEHFVELLVGSVSSPGIRLAGIHQASSGVVLDCECAGWYPEPEVLWLDAEGNLLSAGPTETVRGPDDLYTVSSRLTVEKRHSNSFTCRVQQKDIHQTRETQIQISADCFEVPSFSAARVSIIVVIFLIFISAAAFVVWKWRQNKTKDTKTEDREREQLTAETKTMEDLEEKKAELEEELQKKEKEQEDLEQMVKTLMEQKEELQSQADRLKQQKENMEENMKDTENKVQAVEKMAEGDRYCEMKSIILTAKGRLQDRKQEAEALHLNTQTLVSSANSLLDGMTNRKTAVEKHKEKISETLEEIQRKLQSQQRQETI